MNYHKLGLAFLVFIVASGCSTSSILERRYLGKKLNPSIFKYLSSSGRHIWKHKHFDIDYSYSIDAAIKMITFEGTAIYNVPLSKSKYQSEQVLLEIEQFEIIIIFADMSGKVLAVDSYYFYPKRYLVDPIPFKISVPYQSDYETICFGYNVQSRGN